MHVFKVRRSTSTHSPLSKQVNQSLHTSCYKQGSEIHYTKLAVEEYRMSFNELSWGQSRKQWVSLSMEVTALSEKNKCLCSGCMLTKWRAMSVFPAKTAVNTSLCKRNRFQLQEKETQLRLDREFRACVVHNSVSDQSELFSTGWCFLRDPSWQFVLAHTTLKQQLSENAVFII